MRYGVAYGRVELTLEVPRKRVVGVLAPRETPQVADVAGAVQAALARPLHSPPLHQLLAGKKTALIVTVNFTRPSPRPLIEPVLDACDKAGVKATVIIATGRHRLMTDREIRRHLGKRIMAACKVLQHDAFNAKTMVRKGTTRLGTPIRVNREIFRHDAVIGCGIIEPSYLAGWSGGRKLLMPGLAHHESIDNNHFYLTNPATRIGKLHGNPVSDDAFEFARNLPLDFIVYSVSGPNDEITRVVAGHPIKAHERGCRMAERIYKVTRLEADIVISSAGGRPYDCNLVQGKKAAIPAIETVHRNGVVILCAECPDGLGAESTFVDWLRTKTPLEVVRDVRDRQQFNLGAHGANILARPIVEKNAKVILVTNRRVAEELKGTYVTAMTSLDQAWQTANMLVGRNATVLFIEKARRLIVT